jgi:hypothetical protein
MIDPGTPPVEGAREDLAAANLEAFLKAVRERGGPLADGPSATRRPTATAGSGGICRRRTEA